MVVLAELMTSVVVVASGADDSVVVVVPSTATSSTGGIALNEYPGKPYESGYNQRKDPPSRLRIKSAHLRER